MDDVVMFDIGTEHWSYHLNNGYTDIMNDDGELVVTLRWSVRGTDEAKAAAYGYGHGIKEGIEAGKREKEREIKRALGLA